MKEKYWKKSPWAIRTLSFDASDAIAVDDTISAVTAEVYDSDGVDVSESMVSGSAAWDGTTITQKFTGGTDGEDYSCVIKITTSAGEKADEKLIIQVRARVSSLAITTLITLSEIKDWLDLDDTDADAFLEQAISDWSNAVDTRLGRTILSTDYADEAHDGGKLAVILNNFPVSELTSITVEDGALGDDDYTYNANGIIRLKSGLPFGGGPGDVLVTYTAGYDTAPGDLKRSMKQIVALEYYLSGHGRKALSKRSESTGEGNVTYERGPEDQERIMRRIERLYGSR